MKKDVSSEMIQQYMYEDSCIGRCAMHFDIPVKQVEVLLWGKEPKKRIRPNPPYTPRPKQYKPATPTTIKAVKDLTDNDIRYLNLYANSKVYHLDRKSLEGLEGKDFVANMLEKVLNGVRVWQPSKVDFEHFLYGCIKSDVSCYHVGLSRQTQYLQRIDGNEQYVFSTENSHVTYAIPTEYNSNIEQDMY